MPDAHLRMLSEVAPFMRSLRASPDATVFYEVLSGSLIWTDEIPDASATGIQCGEFLRPVFRFRTTVMLENPEERYREFWEEAYRLFPDWPGFLPWRRSAQHKATYEAMREKAMNEIDAVFD